MQGYRTYITILIMAAYNIARAMGVDFGEGVTAESIDGAVNTILAVVAAVFNYVGRKRIKEGK